MSKPIWRLIGVSCLFCVGGALVGYGQHGTMQSACLGAGIGLVAPTVVIILAFL